MNFRHRFDEKVVIITGGGTGLGQAYCYAFAKEGATVVCADVNYRAAENTQKKILSLGGDALAIYTDVTNSESIKTMLDHVVNKYKKIDILVNNAGIIERLPFLSTTEEAWDRQIDVDLKGVFLVTRAVAQRMIKQKYGKIVNIASIAGITACASTPYTASKGGVIALTRLWAKELASHQIRVNAVAPGFVATPISKSMRETPVGKEIDAKIPFGYGDTDKVVPTVLFLSSEESDWITGQTLVVDGGLTCYVDVGEGFRNFDLNKNEED